MVTTRKNRVVNPFPASVGYTLLRSPAISPRLPAPFPTKLASWALSMGSVGNVPSKNSEDPALFTLSTFLWAKSSSAREKKAPCWQRMATAIAAPTRVVK